MNVDSVLDLPNALYHSVLLLRETGVEMDGQVQAQT